MTEDDLTFKINIKKDERLPPGIGIMGKIKEFPEGEPIIEGVVLNFGEEDRPLTYKGKVIGKIKEIEYNKDTGIVHQYFEIEDEEALKEIKEKANNG